MVAFVVLISVLCTYKAALTGFDVYGISIEGNYFRFIAVVALGRLRFGITSKIHDLTVCLALILVPVSKYPGKI